MSVRATESIEILLVDDDEDDVLMMREALRAAKSSARLQVLSDGLQVIPYLRGQRDQVGANRPDLVLLELSLPGRHGRQVLADIKGVTLASVDDRETAGGLVREAHQVCPYSNATRGNITVDLLLSGEPI